MWIFLLNNLLKFVVLQKNWHIAGLIKPATSYKNSLTPIGALGNYHFKTISIMTLEKNLSNIENNTANIIIKILGNKKIKWDFEQSKLKIHSQIWNVYSDRWLS
jgi:hypothetical protein